MAAFLSFTTCMVIVNVLSDGFFWSSGTPFTGGFVFRNPTLGPLEPPACELHFS